MEIKLKPGEILQGVKIFDGIDKKTNLPYCQPDNNNKQIYQKGENNYDGKIEICRKGFHFSMSIGEACDYKPIISLQSSRNVVIINPVFEVYATGKVISETYSRYGGFSHKFVTDCLYLDRQFSNNVILTYLVTNHLCYIKTFTDISVSTSSTSGSTKCLYQGNAKEITIDSLPSDKNFTIFSDYKDKLTVKNKTKYAHYVNRCCRYEQYITPVPRYSTVEFKPFDKIGKLVKKIK